MQKGTHYIILIVLIVASIGISQPVYGQNNTTLDSLIKASTLEIYDNPDKAIGVGKMIAQDPKNNLKNKIRGLMLVSDGYSSKRDYQKSLEYVLKANQIRVVHKLAAQYQQLKIYDKAIAFLDEGEQLGLAFPVRDSVRFLLGNNYVIRGFIYKEQLNCDIAINFFEKGIREYTNGDDSLMSANLSITYYNIGNCHILMAHNEEAKNSFKKSIAIAQHVNAKSLEGFSLKGLAEVYTLEGKYNEAIRTLEEALVVSKSVGDLILNQGIYKGLAENYLAINEWEKYRIYQLDYLNTQFDVKESERKSISDSLDKTFAQQNSKLQEIIPMYNYGIITTLLITFAVVVFFVFRYKNTQKSNLKLQELIDNLQKNKEKHS
jgi:tetratricopeptide (TPR) repeat protein